MGRRLRAVGNKILQTVLLAVFLSAFMMIPVSQWLLEAYPDNVFVQNLTTASLVLMATSLTQFLLIRILQRPKHGGG